MFGLLNLDKPPGLTSRTVVNRVDWLIGPIPAGHAGTLDPLATGVLLIAIGRATRLIEYVQLYPKRYRGAFLLGQTSDTEDIGGAVVPILNPPIPSRAEIIAALPQFRGEIMQRPPAYSALKINGKRSYKLARRGKAVEHEPRGVKIHALELIDYDYPRMVLDVRCSSGTYIRSLGRDLAESLGSGAVLAELRRTEIGPFHIDQSIDVQWLDRAMIEASLASTALAVGELPQIELSEEDWIEIQNGRSIETPERLRAETEIAALTPRGEVGAILIPREGMLGPKRVFLEDE